MIDDVDEEDDALDDDGLELVTAEVRVNDRVKILNDRVKILLDLPLGPERIVRIHADWLAEVLGEQP